MVSKNTNVGFRISEYFNFFKSLDFLFLHSLYLATVLFTLIYADLDTLLGSLYLLASLCLAIFSALRFRLIGGCITIMILQAVMTILFFTNTGCLGGPDRWGNFVFAAGLIGLFSVTVLSTSIVTGYHVRTEQLERDQHHMLHRVFDAIPLGIWVRAQSGKTIFVNEYWAGFSQASAADIMAKGGTAPPVDLGDEWEVAVDRLLASGDGTIHSQPIELVDFRGTLSSMTLLTVRIFVDQIKSFGTLSLLIDETAIKHFEAKASVNEHRLRSVLDHAEMGIWDRDLEQGESYFDENWWRILGLKQGTPQDALKQWESLLHPDDKDQVLAAYESFFSSDEVSRKINYKIRKGDQRYIWIEDSLREVKRSADGKSLRVLGTIQDISERKLSEITMQQARDRAEAGNMAKGYFIATVSHEIRTPLNAIIGLSSFLVESELEEDQAELAETINASGRSLLAMVNDILDFSKIESGGLDLSSDEFPLRLCFEDSLKLFGARAAEKQVELSMEIEAGLPEYVIGDMERLRQVLQNLLANAVKFTQQGQVSVSVRQADLTSLPAEIRPKPGSLIGYLDDLHYDYLEVMVKDSGVGIPKQSQATLFDAFTQVDASSTRQYGGTGLGLAICKHLVHAMGGEIWVESQPGVGSLFGFVVRVAFVDESALLLETDEAYKIGESMQIEHPCNIIVIGEDDWVSELMLNCRALGYAPHHARDYAQSAHYFTQRVYDLVFISIPKLDTKERELCESVLNNIELGQPKCLVGIGRTPFGGKDQGLAFNHCMKACPDTETIRQLILKDLNDPD